MTNRMFYRNSGIYQITNIKNNKIYIGQSTHLADRRYSHFRLLEKGTHHSSYLQNSYNKHGRNTFIFTVLLYCEIEYLDYYEQILVNKLKPEYNIRKEITSNRGISPSEETRKKISQTQLGKYVSDETRKKLSDSHKGKKMSIENCIKQSQRMMGHKINLGRKWTQKERDNRSEMMKNYWKKVRGEI